MTNFFYKRRAQGVGQRWAMVGLFLLSWLLASTTSAQAPAWALATNCGTPTATSGGGTYAMATDASGNLFVAGGFSGQITFGTITLNGYPNADWFIAKYVPATATWAWAVHGGGSGFDIIRGIAVSGNSVYVTGTIDNSTANINQVSFESMGTPAGTVLVPVLGTNSNPSPDLFVAKYTDNGTSATLSWTQVGGGQGRDEGYAVAVSGTSVYVTGSLINDQANTNQAVFGGTGTIPGAVVQVGASMVPSSDMLVAKYTDQGSSATLGWTQVAGGTSADYGYGIAANGTSVYVTGSLTNNLANSRAVVFGSSGTTTGSAVQYGASTMVGFDLMVAKYTDNGPSATLGWTQVGGGQGYDESYAIAVNGTSLYITGYVTNNRANSSAVVFGGTGSTAGTSQLLGATTTNSFDLLVAKYTDNGPSATLGWTQVGGGTDSDAGLAIAVSGTSVYVTGYASNNTTNSTAVVFGGTGATVGTSAQPGASATISPDVVVAKYTTTGTTAILNWTQIAGGTAMDQGQGIVALGSSLYVAGVLLPVATFGGLAITMPANRNVGFLAGLTNAMLANAPATSNSALHLYPNPAPGPATLSGAPANSPVHIFDALGWRVATAAADASGTATLPTGLAPGVYLVRAGAGTGRWVVE